MHCLRHRGPDEHGTWNDDHLVFGFNRLAIIDIAHSHQPLRWGPPENPERYALTFNGEIYNYLEIRAELVKDHDAKFFTEGDSEAIVAAFHYWGEDAVRRLRGMFAFAIWDTDTRELFIARDPFGIKPLFIATGAGGTAFGSEKKSLLELTDLIGIGTELDPRAIEHYTVLQYVPEPETLHKQIRRLESGSFARVRPGEEPTFTRYFTPKFPAKPFAPGTEKARYQEIAEALEDSVAKHMRADVTVGSFLSGGIDSTAIAALAMRHNPNLITFTTGFEREGYSEVDVAAESAAAIGAKHVVKVVSPAEFAAAIPEIVWYLDDPVADPALIPLWFIAKEARKHVKVVLSGEGADELFGGYTIYREPLSLKPFEYLPKGLRRAAGKLSERIPDGTRGKSLLNRGSLTLEERYYGNARSFNDAQLRAVLRDFRPEWTHQDVTAPIYAQSRDWDPVARMQHLDLFTWLRGDILVKADKMTMANSLELRVPFLDPESSTSRHAYRSIRRSRRTRPSTHCARPWKALCRTMFCTVRSSDSRFPCAIGCAAPNSSTGTSADRGVGYRPHLRQAGRREDAQRSPRGRVRPQPTPVDRPDLHGLARNLRGEAHRAADPGAGVPGQYLGFGPVSG